MRRFRIEGRYSWIKHGVITASLAFISLMTGCITTHDPRVANSADVLQIAGLVPSINAEHDSNKPASLAAPTLDRSLRITAIDDEPIATPEAPPRTSEASPLLLALTPSIPQGGPSYPIDLPTALKLADSENPTIAEARVMILDALAQQLIARSLLVPTLNAGGNYHGHTGKLLRAGGRVLSISEQSLYFGGGARSLAGESVAIPAVNIFSPLTDAIHEPLVARQRVAERRFDASSTANDVLLDVARLYLDLVGAQAELESRRQSASQAEVLVKVVDSYAATGQGRKADSDRARSDFLMLQSDIQHVEEEVAVASARLAARLNLDPSTRLVALAGQPTPIAIIDADADAAELVRTALARRPDVAARTAQSALALTRVRQEQRRPLLPTIWMGFSGAAFGGGSNLVPPLVGNFGGRTDFDVRAYWTLLNLGAGNSALIKRRRAEQGEADAARSLATNRVRDEVISSRAESLALRRQTEVVRAELASAEDGFREDSIRLRETIAIPLEALDSLKLLAEARIKLIEAITKANQAQFALFVAMGSPPPLISLGPMAYTPPTVTTPLRSPIRSGQ